MTAPLKRVEDSGDVELRPCVGYEGLYAASSDGRIWSYPKTKRAWGIWLRAAANEDGYFTVSLCDQSGSARSWLVHRLVAIAFLAVPDDSSAKEVNHKSGTKTDNRPLNLEWCTPKANIQHAYANGMVNTRSPSRLASNQQTIRIASAVRAQQQRSQTHCKYGHELSGHNLRLSNGKRQCRACTARYSRDRRAQKVAI